MSTPVWCDRPDEIGPMMCSKSEGLGVRVDQKNAPVVNHRGGAGPSKGGVNRVGDHFHGDRVVLGWGNQTCTSLTKAAPTSGLGFRAAYAQHDECLEPEPLRWFGCVLRVRRCLTTKDQLSAHQLRQCVIDLLLRYRRNGTDQRM